MALSHKIHISQDALNSQNINSQIHIYILSHKTLCHKKCSVCTQGLNVAKWYRSLHTCNAEVGVTVTDCTCFLGYLLTTSMVRDAQVWLSLRRLDHARWVE